MLDITPVTPNIGALVHGVDLSKPLDDDEVHALEGALADWHVLFFRDQDMTDDEHLALAARFGELETVSLAPTRSDKPSVAVVAHGPDDPPDMDYSESEWHVDLTWREVPTKMTVLRAVEVPDVGGDTLWSDMHAAYDALSEPMQRFLERLRAVHDLGKVYKGADAPPVEHPLVCTHPISGRRHLYVNPLFTTRIAGLSSTESQALLAFLFRLADNSEFQCRFRWERNSVAIWDNRCTQHRALHDYFPRRRVVHRVMVRAEARPS